MDIKGLQKGCLAVSYKKLDLFFSQYTKVTPKRLTERKGYPFYQTAMSFIVLVSLLQKELSYYIRH